MRGWKRDGVLALALVLIGLVVFGEVIRFEFVQYDDPAYVTENGYVNRGVTADGLRWAVSYGGGGPMLRHEGVQNLWHPLTWVSHMVDVELFGLEAGGHHGTNLALHIVSAILVMLVFREVLGSAAAGFVAAVFFLVHPLKVESVAWVSERKDVLSGVFFWGAVWPVVSGWKDRRPDKPGDGGGVMRGRGWRWAGLGCFALALMSKPSVLVLPVLLVLLDGYVGAERDWGPRFWLRGLKRWWPWFALALVMASVTLWTQAGGSHSYFIAQGSTLGRVMAGGAGLLFYLWRILVPWDLSFHYPYPDLAWPAWLGAWVVVTALAGGTWVMRRRWPGVFFGAAWLLVCWLPVSGLAYVGTSFTADRYLYLATAGPAAVLAAWLAQRKWGIAVAGCVALAWAGLAWVQTGVWRNSKVLFQHAVEAQPRSALAWTNLGGLYLDEQNWEEAVACQLTAVELNPNEYAAWYNLGLGRAKTGDPARAREAYERSLKAYPSYLPALQNLGLLVRDDGDLQEAAAYFERGCEATRYRHEVLVWLLCETELARGLRARALELLSVLRTLEPRNPAVREGMARMDEFLGN